MIRLSEKDVLKMHSLLLEKTGGRAGIRDIGLLVSALNAPFQTFDGNDIYPTLEEKAARLAYGLVNNHPFVDGNKRSGLLAMLVFLEMNGINLEFEQAELIKLGLELASGEINSSDVLTFINEHKESRKDD